MNMIDCPRCGFAQPEDRFCAKCGLDIEQYQKRPKPLFQRLAQNPNLPLGLILIVVLVVSGYIVYSQRELVGQEVKGLFDTPLSSRQAEVQPKPKSNAIVVPTDKDLQVPVTGDKVIDANDDSELTTALESRIAPSDEPKKNVVAPVIEYTRLELGFWEVPRELLVSLIQTAEKIGESGSGRAYLFSNGEKMLSLITKDSARVTMPRYVDLATSTQLSIESPAGLSNRIQFGFFLWIEEKEREQLNLRFESQIVLPIESETAGQSTVSEVALSGVTTLKGKHLLAIVLEPPVRNVRPETVASSGDGPWSVVSSNEYRSGLTEWVGLIQILPAP